eukprot:6413678-Lingulodinium_polyedra.AAC.1
MHSATSEPCGAPGAESPRRASGRGPSRADGPHNVVRRGWPRGGRPPGHPHRLGRHQPHGARPPHDGGG